MQAPLKRRGRKPLVARETAEQELTDHYHQYFESLPALGGPMLDAAFQLRYRVLCEERQLLDPADYPQGKENDIYDPHAMHAVLRYRPDSKIVAAMRVIFPEDGLALPVFDYEPALRNEVDPKAAVELSRFVIAKDFRRRAEDGFFGEVHHGGVHNQRRTPHIAIGLMRMALEFTQGRGVSHVVALAEPAMLRMLQGLGIHFAPAGDLVECHGLRQPCYAKIENLLRRVKMERPELWRYITDNGRLG